MRALLTICLLACPLAANPPDETLTQRARRYLGDLIRLDSTYPPGNETRVAKYLKQVADAEGIESELLGDNPDRLNFVARLRGSGSQRPLLLMAHSDVVPADPSLWSVPPYSGEIRDGFIYGRGAEDDKSLLAAEMAILVDLKRRGLKLQFPARVEVGQGYFRQYQALLQPVDYQYDRPW